MIVAINSRLGCSMHWMFSELSDDDVDEDNAVADEYLD
jgi:hypothetical protein